MNQTTSRRRPSLAHRIIVTTDNDSKLQEERILSRLPFPELNPDWDGFTVSPLHWVGIKIPDNEITEELRERQLKIVTYHELYHRDLGKTAYARLMRMEMLKLYGLIGKCIDDDRQEPILVPFLGLDQQSRDELHIKSDDPWNVQLQKQAAIVLNLTRMSDLVEEIFAIRSSLSDSVKENLIEDAERQTMIRNYKRAYRDDIPLFPATYDIFEFVAGKIGITAAAALIYNCFATLNPNIAFLDILSEMCKTASYLSIHNYRWGISEEQLRWKLSAEDTKNLNCISFLGAYYTFSRLLTHLDPEDSFYRRKMIKDLVIYAHDYHENLKEQPREDESVSLLFGTPSYFLLTMYHDRILPVFLQMASAETIEHGAPVIIHESIRQQITQGIGLVCPFWLLSPGKCCGSFNKAFLEKVWSRTCPTGNCEHWERMGCLGLKG
jgi:hypothetical protein